MILGLVAKRIASETTPRPSTFGLQKQSSGIFVVTQVPPTGLLQDLCNIDVRCEETKRRSATRVISLEETEPLVVVGKSTRFQWVHPIHRTLSRGTVIVGRGSAKAAGVMQQTVRNNSNAGNTSA